MGISPVLAGQAITAGMLNGLPVTLSTLVNGSIANSAVETTIGTFTVPANDAVAGSGYEFRVLGSADVKAATTPTMRFRLRLTNASGTLLMQGAALTATAGNGRAWGMRGYIYANAAGSSGLMDGWTWWAEALQSATPSEGASSVTQQAVDWTSPVVLCVTAAWGTADVANIARTLDGGLNRC
jgi:hypothetical protein